MGEKTRTSLLSEKRLDKLFLGVKIDKHLFRRPKLQAFEYKIITNYEGENLCVHKWLSQLNLNVNGM